MTRGSLAISCVPRVWRWSLWALALVALYGCVGVSPRNVVADRMDYGQVVADSWKRQALLNVVRLRYADAPVFLDVSSIINSYTIGGNANAQATLPSGSPNVLAIGGTGSWSNSPTVTYQPLMGERFTKSLLQNIPPVSIFQLLQGGWPVELVLRTSVNSINGLQNDRSGIAASSGFDELVERLSRLHAGGEVGLRVEARADGSGVIVVMRSKATQETLNEDSRRVRELLGLSSDITEFDVVYGLVPRNQREVALLSRSMLEIMLQLGHGIDLPATHEEGGWVLASQYRSGERLAKPLVNIHSGSEAPANAYAAVPYLGYWYWIDQADIASKRTFTFLMILFSLAETGPSAAAPVVTVPSR